MSELEDLARVPGVAAWVMHAVTRYRAAAKRTNGAAPTFPAEVARFLECLQEISTGTTSPDVGSEFGTTPGSLSDVTGMKPAAVAADEIGLSDSYVRRLARRGRVRSHRAGAHGLLVDVDGLRRVISNSRRTAG